MMIGKMRLNNLSYHNKKSYLFEFYKVNMLEMKNIIDSTYMFGHQKTASPIVSVSNNWDPVHRCFFLLIG